MARNMLHGNSFDGDRVNFRFIEQETHTRHFPSLVGERED